MGHLMSKQKSKKSTTKKKGRAGSAAGPQDSSVNANRPTPAVPAPRPATSPTLCMFTFCSIIYYYYTTPTTERNQQVYLYSAIL